MANELAEFEVLLGNLMSADNNVRTQAEENYDGIPAVNKIPLLIQSMARVENAIEARTMAAVLLRRLYTSSFEEFWPQFPPELQQQVKDNMLHCVNEPNPIIRRKMCDCTAELARNLMGTDETGNVQWADVLKLLFECAQSQDAGRKESALHIFSVVPGIFGESQKQHLDVIKQMLAVSLTDSANQNVRHTAVKATCAFILANDKDTHVLNHFKDLLPHVLTGIEESIKAQEDDALLKCLIDLVEATPKYVRPQVERLMNTCMQVVGDKEMLDSWRQLALEVITGLAENAPAMVRKFGAKFLPVLVPQMLAMMVELEDEEDWATGDEVEDDDNDSNAIAGESALDRLACALGGKAMLPHIISNVPAMLQNPDWKYRHAALMAISACGEGCHKQMEAMLPSIVESVLPFLQDPHPRVRYATCNALGQMSTDFGPTFQKKFHERVVPGLLHVMDDNANPRVQAHAGAALVNFSEDCPKTILTPYLDLIIAKLEQVLSAKFKELMEKGQKMVLEQVVTTIASVADTAEEKFLAYYDRFMPCLKYIVQNASQPELRMLRGKTIECISLIGLAVGKEKFMQDCSDVMQLLLKTQTEWNDLPEDDPQISYMISAWARMCKIMGKEFEQYLPLVMGPLLRAAQIKPEVALVDAEDQESLEADADWQFVTLGDQQSFGIRTSGLEEKATACQMLVCYARELNEGFAPYAEEVCKIMVSHLKFYFHDGVRIAAAESLPFLLDCAQIRGAQNQQLMWQFIVKPLLQSIDSEPENDIKAEYMGSLAQCIEKMGANCLDNENMTALVEILEKIVNDHFNKQSLRQDKRKEEDYDEDLEEMLLDEDDEDVFILSKLSDIMHSLFGTYKTAILPVFEKLLPHFVNLLQPERPWADKQWSLCIFDDLLEHAGPAAENYQAHFVQHMVAYLVDKIPEVRQAAAYGVGVMAQYGGPAFVPVLQQACPLLMRVIQDPESRQPENANPTENAISAVTKICKYRPECLNVNEVLAHWLSWLPVWEDEDEAVHIYGYLCELIEANNPVILGADNQNLPRILAIIAESLVRQVPAPDSEVAAKLLLVAKQIQGNPVIFQACLQHLSPEQTEALSQAMSQQ